MQSLIRCLVMASLSIGLPVFAATDSNLPDEGPVPVSALPADVMAAAQSACSGFLANSASFNWSRDTGMFVIEGRCGGGDVRIHVTGDARVDYFTKLDE